MKPLTLGALLLFIIGAVWALTLSEPAVRAIQRKYFGLIAPALKTGDKLEIIASRTIKEVDHSRELELKLAAAEEELAVLKTQVTRLRELERENNAFREVLDFSKRTPFEVSAARVMRRNPANWWQQAIIDAGSQSQVQPNAPVIGLEGLVGKVESLENDLSTVLLLTDEACLVSAKIEGTHEVGILSGRRGQLEANPLLSLRFLSKDAPIREGQRVFSTGDGGVFPPNILLGTIQQVNRRADSSEAFVRPAVDFENLDVVFVVKIPQPDESDATSGS